MQTPVVTPQAPDHPVAVARPTPSGAGSARSRNKKFWSYYQPYKGIFFADMACALIVSAVTLALPLCAQYITTNVLQSHAPHAL
ncbi:MAG TPA: hypothetical protein VMV29_03565, partial [Ktedonobacterales bacterium]|nr:hypothetical protein [Ktedonobacterales bacterium]